MPGPDTDFDLTIPAAAEAIAKFPHGAYLDCLICGKARKASGPECETFAVSGWPRCCEQTMLASAREERSMDARQS